MYVVMYSTCKTIFQQRKGNHLVISLKLNNRTIFSQTLYTYHTLKKNFVDKKVYMME